MPIATLRMISCWWFFSTQNREFWTGPRGHVVHEETASKKVRQLVNGEIIGRRIKIGPPSKLRTVLIILWFIHHQSISAEVTSIRTHESRAVFLRCSQPQYLTFFYMRLWGEGRASFCLVYMSWRSILFACITELTATPRSLTFFHINYHCREQSGQRSRSQLILTSRITWKIHESKNDLATLPEPRTVTLYTAAL